ncbi:MAG: hypothetical protein ACREM1_24890 [Longimicrobiales bacterium]
MHRLRFGTTAGWKRSLGELTLIVVGVLIALGANAWWEGRVDRGRERSWLRQLLADVRENEARIEGAIEFNKIKVAELARFRDAVAAFTRPDTGPLPPGDSLASWSSGFSFDDLEALTGTYTALVQTGDVQLLHNDSLRFRVIAYAADMEALREEMRQKENQMWRSFEQWWQSQAWFHLFSRESVDVASVLGDPELLGLLVTRHTTGSEHVEDLVDIRQPTRRLRCLLESELEGVSAVEVEPAEPRPPITTIDETVQLKATVHF